MKARRGIFDNETHAMSDQLPLRDPIARKAVRAWIDLQLDDLRRQAAMNGPDRAKNRLDAKIDLTLQYRMVLCGSDDD